MSGDTYAPEGKTECLGCNLGFYVASDGECVACPEGTECESDGESSQRYLKVARGFWRISANSVDVRACVYGELGCLGDNDTMASDLMLGGNNSWAWSRRRLAAKRRRLLAAAGDIYGDAYCAEGYMGPLCAVCDPNGYYLDVSGEEPVNLRCAFVSRTC